jgi:hypothetical protein
MAYPSDLSTDCDNPAFDAITEPNNGDGVVSEFVPWTESFGILQEQLRPAALL